MTIKVQIGLRVTEETREKLIKQAEKENRSVNNLIETIIEKYLNETENKQNLNIHKNPLGFLPMSLS